MPMEYKAFSTAPKSVEGRRVTGYASVYGVWDDNFPRPDRVAMGASKRTIKERGSRGKIKNLWGHASFEPPTAAIVSLREVGREELPTTLLKDYPEATGALEVVRDYLNDPFSERVFQGITSGAISEMSVGYETKDEKPEMLDGVTGRNILEWALWEVSDVNWGMNGATMAAKAAIPYADRGKADKAQKWNKPTLGDFTEKGWEELGDTEKKRIAAHYAWFAEMPPAKFEDLKLPHHEPAKSGVGPAVWNGVKSAMGVLMGAMGGVDVPEAGRRAIYDHLAKHYGEFDETAPDFKMVRLALVASELLLPEDLTLAELRILNEKHADRLTDALKVVRDTLASSESPTEKDWVSPDLVRASCELWERSHSFQPR